MVGHKGNFLQDNSKPDGTMCKVIDVSKIQNLGLVPKIDLPRGVALAYEDYLSRNKH
jgi:GDP-L-fucose synthase